jgi:hypothetical protein
MNTLYHGYTRKIFMEEDKPVPKETLGHSLMDKLRQNYTSGSL